MSASNSDTKTIVPEATTASATNALDNKTSPASPAASASASASSPAVNADVEEVNTLPFFVGVWNERVAYEANEVVFYLATRTCYRSVSKNSGADPTKDVAGDVWLNIEDEEYEEVKPASAASDKKAAVPSKSVADTKLDESKKKVEDAIRQLEQQKSASKAGTNGGNVEDLLMKETRSKEELALLKKQVKAKRKFLRANRMAGNPTMMTKMAAVTEKQQKAKAAGQTLNPADAIASVLPKKDQHKAKRIAGRALAGVMPSATAPAAATSAPTTATKANASAAGNAATGTTASSSS